MIMGKKNGLRESMKAAVVIAVTPAK